MEGFFRHFITIDKLGPAYSYHSTTSLLHILFLVAGRKCGVYKDQIHTIIKHCYEAGAEKGDTILNAIMSPETLSS